MAKRLNFSDLIGTIFGIGVILFIGYLIGSSIFGAITNASEAKGSCKNVTSYDYNWDNDMLCTREDGSKFYTDYDGAKRFELDGSETASEGYTPSDQTSPEVSDTPGAESSEETGGSCIDVTSYDYDWSNDMLCTRSDGTTFYTDYAGADAFEG